MAIVACVSGLGERSRVSFFPLKARLIAQGHTVVFADVSHVQTHEDRVQAVVQTVTEIGNQKGDIFLVGQSAGGSAVRVAAERLKDKVAGIVLLSPAMPRGIFFMTRTLFRIMMGRILSIFAGTDMTPTEKEYRDLISPVLMPERVVRFRTKISGVEARTLAFCPPKLGKISCPVLHVWGLKDQWISPFAQKKFNKIISEMTDVSTITVPNSGHLTLLSSAGEWVIESIVAWIEKGRR